MAHAVLERKETVYYVKNEGIILGNLLTSEKKANLECLNEKDSRKIDNIDNYAKYHEEFIPITTMKQMFAFRNHGVY